MSDKSTLIKDVLLEEGLSEYTVVLLAQGLSDISDIAAVSEEDLKEIGIEKMFHRRKLMKLANHPALKKIVSGDDVTDDRGARHFGGDKVHVEILGARGNNGTLSEKEFYVKACQCTLVDKCVIPTGHGQKTTLSRGPFPVWGGETGNSQSFDFPTDFRSHCISFELKEKRLISDNKVIGVVIFPPKFFHKFTEETVVDSWFPLRLAYEEEGEVQAYLRLKFTVPGGCPQGAKGRIFHVKGVSMTQRKLRLTVFEAELVNKSNPNGIYGEQMLQAKAANAPPVYIQIELDDADRTTHKTAVVKNSFNPAFDETFEFFMEVSQAKLITLKLRESVSLGSDKTLGILHIPIQFFLCQKEATDADQVHPLLDEKDKKTQIGKLHVRLQVRNREGQEKRISFRRTRSLKEEVKRDSPAFEDDIGTVLVNDDGASTTDDEDAHEI